MLISFTEDILLRSHSTTNADGTVSQVDPTHRGMCESRGIFSYRMDASSSLHVDANDIYPEDSKYISTYLTNWLLRTL